MSINYIFQLKFFICHSLKMTLLKRTLSFNGLCRPEINCKRICNINALYELVTTISGHILVATLCQALMLHLLTAFLLEAW